MNRDELRDRLSRFERIGLSSCPTPLEPLPRLSAQVGRPLWIKRDDNLGPGLGGNKVRKLEFLMAEAQRAGYRKVATFGGLQSNHARLTAAAANRLGMQAHLFYFEPRPHKLTGNLAINHALGATLHFIPLGGGGNSRTVEQTIRLVRWVVRLLAGRCYFIPVGGHNPLGGLGYVEAALEIDEQCAGLGIENAYLVTAAGSGGTLAGLIAGLRLLDSRLCPVGVDVGKLWHLFPASIARLAGEITLLLGAPLDVSADRVPLIENRYVGAAYGSPSLQGQEALRLLAQTEGILLDPVYTAKAFAGMLDMIRGGELGKHEPAIFLHTGGLPAIFAFDENAYIA